MPVSMKSHGKGWTQLFPTRWSFVIFILYMALFINQGILITASQTSNHKGYNYNTVMAVLLTEVIKLIVSTGMFVQRNSTTVFCKEVKQNGKVFLLYFIPAGLYCLYNNLAYTNLITFDPTSYFLLLQLRVVVTGIVFQILFNKKLSKYQWLSLMLLTVGCMVKQINFKSFMNTGEIVKFEHKATKSPDKAHGSDSDFGFLQNPLGIILIFLQVLCSSSAGVYNEFLLKRPPTSKNQKQLPVLIQNVCLYVDSIICNLSLLVLQGNLGAAMNFESLKLIFSTPIVLAVVLNNAAIGIVTSFFLAQLNSILKTFASALELMFTAVLCWLIFGIPIYQNTIIAIFIVTIAILLYSKEPVHNPLPSSSNTVAKDEEDMQKILDEELVA